MNMKFGKLNLTGGVEYAPQSVWTTIHHHDEWDEHKLNADGEPTGETEHKVKDWDERKYVLHPTDEQYLDAGWKYVTINRPEDKAGFTLKQVGWREESVSIFGMWEYEPIPVSVEDYDAAMEEHIRQAREERGYTTREPSEYLSSSVPRWAQDAADFVRFRDRCMVIGLDVINRYKDTGDAPSLGEFKAMLPKCEWTYADNEEKKEA